MSEGASQQIHTLPPAEAARWLGVDEAAIRALVQARYLSVVEGGIPFADVRAFQARNAEGGSGSAYGVAAQSTDVEALIDALDRRVDELSARAYEVFIRFIPEARQWSPSQRETFISQAKGRFSAVLAVIEHGSQVDEALQADLKEVGANAAWAGSSLPHLLLVLRISRDLLLQTALQISEEGHGRWNSILSKFIASLLPAIDRLTDAISSGFWGAQVERRQEELDRANALIEHSPFGVYEADIDGIVQYANTKMASIVGHPENSLVDVSLADIFKPVSGSITQLLAEPVAGATPVELVIDRDGTEVSIEVETFVRRIDDEAVGFAGIVRVISRDEIPAFDKDESKQSAQSLADQRSGEPGYVVAKHVDLTPIIRHIFELRRSIEILSDAGTFLRDNSGEMTAEQLQQAGDSMQRQAERLMIIVDELDLDRKNIQSS